MTAIYKKVLVTGGAGCIGLQICKELLERNIEVVLFDLPEQIARVSDQIISKVQVNYGSILDCSSLRDAMVDCDAIIHLAAYLGVRRTENNKLRCLEININGTQNVLDCAVQHRIKKIVFASSSEVYGEPLTNPISENQITQGKTVYAITKMAGEELCKAYHQRYPFLDFTIVRYFNAYGPFQTAQFVIPKFIKNVIEDKSPVIYGDGTQTRSYCYAADTAWASIESLLQQKANGEVINIGNPYAKTTLSELANLVINVCGKTEKIKPVFQPVFALTDRAKEREIFERFCDISKAEKLLNFKPQISLIEGIGKVLSHGTIFPHWQSTDVDYSLDE